MSIVNKDVLLLVFVFLAYIYTPKQMIQYEKGVKNLLSSLNTNAKLKRQAHPTKNKRHINPQ